jgi:sulfide:quinone oxidoreductase
MKKIVILGAGTAGTIMANKLCKALDREEWEITIIDKEKTHYYQPGFLFIPFGIYTKQDVIKPVKEFIPDRAELIQEGIKQVVPRKNRVILDNGKDVDYDFLIIATGTHLEPSETSGMQEKLWYKSIFDFYSLEGALALYEYFRNWQGGKLVMAITELPFKCPVAPIEFVCLAEAFFKRKGIRDKVEITLVTPLSGAFTKPVASHMLSDLMGKKNINIVPDFYIERIDNENKKLISYDEKEVSFDVLAIVPMNKGADFIGVSGLGDDMNFVPVNKQTLQHEQYANIFALGDAAALPTSKAGSVAHFSAEILFENLMCAIEHRPLSARFDGHANCYIETGYGRGTLVDFNYDTEPLPGTFPLPGIGPFGLLKNTRINHYGKLLFKWIYWNILLKGMKIPMVHADMSMIGKKTFSNEQ